jgi:uncharacterized membrane protein
VVWKFKRYGGGIRTDRAVLLSLREGESIDVTAVRGTRLKYLSGTGNVGVFFGFMYSLHEVRTRTRVTQITQAIHVSPCVTAVILRDTRAAKLFYQIFPAKEKGKCKILV